MNKILRKYLILVLMLPLLFAQTVPAGAEASITFSENSETKDDVVFYEIEITPGSKICGLSMQIEYPEEQVRVKNCAVGELLDGGMVKSNCAILGEVIFSYISVAPLEDGGAVLLIEFEPLSTDNQNIDIDCNLTECIDYECNEIAYVYVDQEILNPKYVAPTQDDPTSNEQDHQTDLDHVGDNNKKPNPGNPIDKNNENIGTNNPKPPSGSQEGIMTEKTDSGQNETVPDETVPQISDPDDAGHTEVAGDPVPQKRDEQEKNMDRDANCDFHRWLLIVGGVGLAALLTVICLLVVKPILLKRRSDNEKK